MAAHPAGKLFRPRHGLRVVEKRATACLEVCRKKLGLQEIPLPVPIEEWIEGPLGIRLGIESLAHLGDDVLGAAFVEQREILVSDQVLAHEGRFRFTCAHELGHLILHRSVQASFKDLATADPWEASRYELQADRFAASFLMPIPLLERELFRICKDHGLDLRSTIVELMLATAKSESLWRGRFLPEITRRFKVSLTAALIRCGDLRLQGGDERPLLPPLLAEGLRKSKQELLFDPSRWPGFF